MKRATNSDEFANESHKFRDIYFSFRLFSQSSGLNIILLIPFTKIYVNNEYTKKTVWLLSRKQNFFVGPTKYWLRQQKLCRINKMSLIGPTKLLLS